MPTLLRRLRRFVLGLLTAVLRATGREPLVAPEPLPMRRTVVDTMTEADREALARHFRMQASLALIAGQASGKLVCIEQAEA